MQPERAIGASTQIVRGLTSLSENKQLAGYEQRCKGAFDRISPVLKQIATLQHEADFEQRAQSLASRELGFELPADILENAWVCQLDMKRLYAWCVFETYRRHCDDFYHNDPLRHEAEAKFDAFLQSCGFHTVDVSPCSDGRLAHVVRYVFRLPHRAVRRKSYAGANFDIDDSVQKWTETELLRLRAGGPDTVEAPTRYLKIVVYHHSSIDPDHEGCAAHGSDTEKAARAGLDRLMAFKAAVENSFCCGASIDLLLLGIDTDTDALRIHIPDQDGSTSLEDHLDTQVLFDTGPRGGDSDLQNYLEAQVAAFNKEVSPGMASFIVRLMANNLAQIDYVQRHHGERYADIGHAERFIGAGIGFEEIQLRNLMYFAYLSTVEEATADFDVGINIFTRLNVSRGLPIPIVVRFDYHAHIPGARERALQRCAQVDAALRQRYSALFSQGLLHILQVTRDSDAEDSIEIVRSSTAAHAAGVD